MTNKYSFLILCLCLFFCHDIYAQTNRINWTEVKGKIANSTLDEGTDPEDNSSSAWRWGTPAERGWKLTGLKGTTGAWIPEQNKFYHMVGVYDRNARTITLYRDGENTGSVSAKGKMVLAKSSDTSDPYKYHKFTLVGDPAFSNHNKEDICAQTIPSEVVMARMYDGVLTEAQVKQLYEQVKPLAEYEGTTGSKDQASADLVTNVQYLSEVDALSSGSKFVIYADGLQSNDQITFTNANGSSSATKATTFTSSLNIMPAKTGMQRVSGNATISGNSASCTLPTIAATYKMTLTRGSQKQNIGYMRINSVVEKLNYGNTFGIVAHRGVHTSAPENSIEALKIAMENNLYGSETDVVRTSDGTLVINHDNYFNNSTHKSTSDQSATSIPGNKYATIKDFTLTNGEQLPTLAMYLQAYKDYLLENQNCKTKLIIEIKQGTDDNATKVVAKAAFDQVNQAELFDKVEYICFSWAACTAMSAYTYNSKNPTVYYLCNNVRNNRDSYYMKHTGNITGGVDYNIYPTDNIVPLLEYTATGKDYTYQGYKSQGLKVNAYTINTLAEARTTLGRGCDFITANNPIELKMLKEYIDLNNNITQ